MRTRLRVDRTLPYISIPAPGLCRLGSGMWLVRGMLWVGCIDRYSDDSLGIHHSAECLNRQHLLEAEWLVTRHITDVKLAPGAFLPLLHGCAVQALDDVEKSGNVGVRLY